MATTKREIARRISGKTGVPQEVVRDVVQAFLDEIIQELTEGERLEFRDFGVFESVVRGPRKARNPRTGEPVQIPEKRVVHFKPGRLMKQSVLHGSGGDGNHRPSDGDGRSHATRTRPAQEVESSR
jgi:integration host factor subunit beta